MLSALVMAGDSMPVGVGRLQFDAAALGEDPVCGGLERFAVNVGRDGENETAAGPGDRDVIAARSLEVGEVDRIDVLAEELVFAPGTVPRSLQDGRAGVDRAVGRGVADFERRGRVVFEGVLGELEERKPKISTDCPNRPKFSMRSAI